MSSNMFKPLKLVINRPALGVELCRTAWLAYMGVGKSRVHRTKKWFRGIDDRTLAQSAFHNLWNFLYWLGVNILRKLSMLSFYAIQNFRTNLCPETGCGNRTSEQTASVNTFLAHLYWSAAESMPVQFLVKKQSQFKNCCHHNKK